MKRKLSSSASGFEKKPINVYYQMNKPEKAHPKVKVLTKNQKIIGKYQATFHNEEYDTYTHLLDTQEEGQITIKGCKILNDAFRGLKRGTLVEIIYLGKGKPKKGQRPPYLFDVYDLTNEVSDDEAADTDGLSEETDEEEQVASESDPLPW